MSLSNWSKLVKYIFIYYNQKKNFMETVKAGKPIIFKTGFS